MTADVRRHDDDRVAEVDGPALAVGQTAVVEQLEEYGFGDPERKLLLDDLIRGTDVVFAATGITAGESLEGVRYFRGGARTHTVVMSTEPRVVRFMDTIHALEPEAGRRGFQL